MRVVKLLFNVCLVSVVCCYGSLCVMCCLSCVLLVCVVCGFMSLGVSVLSYGLLLMLILFLCFALV